MFMSPGRFAPIRPMRAGVLFLQGAAPEHIQALKSAFQAMGIEGTASPVRKKKDLEGLDCLIIPGVRARPSPSSCADSTSSTMW